MKPEAARVRVILIEPSAAPVLVEIPNTLEGFRTLLGGGYLEGVRLAAEIHAYVDEDGIGKALPPNAIATQLYRAVPGRSPWSPMIAGPMILVGSLGPSGEHDGFDHDIPPGFLEMLVARIAGRAGDFAL